MLQAFFMSSFHLRMCCVQGEGSHTYEVRLLPVKLLDSSVFNPVRLQCSIGMHQQPKFMTACRCREHREEYESFLGEDIEQYLTNMYRQGCWCALPALHALHSPGRQRSRPLCCRGDELTLRAACDSYGCVINCLTSDQVPAADNGTPC